MRNNLIVRTPIEGLHLSLNRLQALTTLVDRLGAECSLKREPVEFEVQVSRGGVDSSAVIQMFFLLLAHISIEICTFCEIYLSGKRVVFGPMVVVVELVGREGH